MIKKAQQADYARQSQSAMDKLNGLVEEIGYEPIMECQQHGYGLLRVLIKKGTNLKNESSRLKYLFGGRSLPIIKLKMMDAAAKNTIVQTDSSMQWH
jgi:hypothetical protein